MVKAAEIDEEKLIALRAAIQVGLDDIEAGRYIEIKGEEELKALFEDLGSAALAARHVRDLPESGT